ncbi:hypothetical protein KIN20_014255 [Parelaphostrongylus tenuis]|uniref:Uncharacterized protein n=1 Tax=Parelaphostrongylus tenuis TaxID=148309 RepID=A0AAD5MZ86_PARTN|nr:hypothetical protein KIN20_014255 [Parelaphostrongylus tenuis]
MGSARRMFWQNFSMTSISTIAMWQRKKRYSVTPIVVSSLGNMAKGPTHRLLIFLLTTGAVLGCGTLPAASRTWSINVTGFSLPVAMAFSTDAAARAQVPQISPNSGSAEAFVKRLVIQGVLNVLEQQERAAGLPDFNHYNHFESARYQRPLHTTIMPCVTRDMPAMMMRTTCVIFGNTVTTTCLGMGAPGAPGVAAGAGASMCRLDMPMDFTPIPPRHLSISETLTV